jgi:hypothetical protein
MTDKLTVIYTDWCALHRNTLVGFATIRIRELRLEIAGVAIHEKNGKRWAQLPARPQVKDGALVRDADGKIAYAPIMQFDSRALADAFSARVIAASVDGFPQALEPERASP